MSATKVRLGRDPELHLIHETRAEADAYTGRPGELTYVRSAPAGPLIQVRAHDGLVKGGYAVQLEPPTEITTFMRLAAAVPPMNVAVPGTSPYTVHHQLGYFPIVQVLNTAGAQVGVNIVHNDAENVTLTFPVAGNYTLILR
jgi:hypothetical protein